MGTRLIQGHSPYEQVVGYSRAVVSGSTVHVSGTAPIPREGDPPDGAYEQMRLCLEIVGGALAEAGAGFEDVVRTRIYLTHAEDYEEIARAHGGDVADFNAIKLLGKDLATRYGKGHTHPAASIPYSPRS